MAPHLSDIEKGKLVLLFEQGHTVYEASQLLGVSVKTAKRWRKRYEEEGDAGLRARYDKCGRKRKTTEEEDGRMVEVGICIPAI